MLQHDEIIYFNFAVWLEVQDDSEENQLIT